MVDDVYSNEKKDDVNNSGSNNIFKDLDVEFKRWIEDAERLLGDNPKKSKKQNESKEGFEEDSELYAGNHRKRIILNDENIEKNVDMLLEYLEKEGYDFSVGHSTMIPPTKATRVLVIGNEISSLDRFDMIEPLAKAFGASIAATRPAADKIGWILTERVIGAAGVSFSGDLYIGCGVSGAAQHIRGVRNALTIVAINKDKNARIFKECDYGIVGDIFEVAPIICNKIKPRATTTDDIKRLPRDKIERKNVDEYYVCSGCGFEYHVDTGNSYLDIKPGTRFEELPDYWDCPFCSERKSGFIPGFRSGKDNR